MRIEKLKQAEPKNNALDKLGRRTERNEKFRTGVLRKSAKRIRNRHTKKKKVKERGD